MVKRAHVTKKPDKSRKIKNASHISRKFASITKIFSITEKRKGINFPPVKPTAMNYALKALVRSFGNPGESAGNRRALPFN